MNDKINLKKKNIFMMKNFPMDSPNRKYGWSSSIKIDFG